MEIGKIVGSWGSHTITRGHINAFSNCAKMWGHRNIHVKMWGHKKITMGSQKGPAILTCTDFFVPANLFFFAEE